MVKKEVDICGMTETNTNWKHKRGRKKLKRITSKYWNRDPTITSECKLDWKSLHKPGGTATIVRQSIKYSIVSISDNPHDLGQWNSCTIRGNNNQHITFVTAYRTCKCDIVIAGINTFATQQWTYFEQQEKEDVNLRAKLISDLAIFINDIRQQQHKVILMIDANESMTKTNSGISNLISLTQLCDPRFMLHGANREPNTYIRGIERIDYCFCTPKLLKYIIRCGIPSFDMVTISDHRGAYLDIKLSKFLQDHFQEHQEPIQRRLYSTFTKGVVKYKYYLYKYTDNNNITETIQSIKQQTINNTLQIEDMGIINDDQRCR